MTCELRLGRWQEVLAEETCDTFVSDPPYSERVHTAQRQGRRQTGAGYRGRAAARAAQTTAEVVGGSDVGNTITTKDLGYASIDTADVRELVQHWSPRTRGWMCLFTSHDLVPVYTSALEEVGRYVFAPLSCVQTGMNVRLAGDGPSNWTTWLVVARPRTLRAWGALPGAYVGTPNDPGLGYERVPGGKPLWLMRAVVRDYSRAGDVVCDPYGGGATTLLAARHEGRSAIGAEMDAERYALAQRNLTRPYSLSLFGGGGS